MTTATTTSWLESTLTDHFTARSQLRRVRLATTANHALSGLAAVDGVVPQAGDRILAPVQTDDTARLVYIAASGGWAVATDSDGEGDLFPGVEFYVQEGTVYGGQTLRNSATTEPVYPGSTSLTWDVISGSGFGGVGSITTVDPADAASAGVASASARVDHQHAVNSATAATVSTLVARDGSGITALQALQVGDGVPAYANGGTIRGCESFVITARNAADNLNRIVVSLDDADDMLIGDGTVATITIDCTSTLSCVSGAAATFGCTAGACVIATADDASTATLSAGTAGNAVSVACSSSGDAITCTVNGTASLALSTTAATLGVASLTWTEGLAPTVQQVIRTGDAAANALILASQTPSTTSTGANRDAKRVRIQIPSPQGAGAESYVGVEISGTERAQIGRYSAVFNDGNSGKAVRIGAHYPAGSPGTSYAAIYFGSGATSPNSTTYGFLGDNADTYLNAPTGVLYLMKAGAVHTTLTEAGSAYTITLGPTVSMLLTAAATTAAITANKAQALTISIGTQTTDTAPKDLTLTPGQPWASATSTNRKPGDLVRALGAPSNSGTTHAAVRTTRGSTSLRLEGKGEVTTTDATSTVVYTYTLADDTGVSLRARMISFRTDSGTNCNVDVLEAAAKRRGGGATIVGTPTTVLQEDAAFTSYTATVSGNDLRVEVQARGAETWKHRVHVEIIAEEIT